MYLRRSGPFLSVRKPKWPIQVKMRSMQRGRRGDAGLTESQINASGTGEALMSMMRRRRLKPALMQEPAAMNGGTLLSRRCIYASSPRGRNKGPHRVIIIWQSLLACTSVSRGNDTGTRTPNFQASRSHSQDSFFRFNLSICSYHLSDSHRFFLGSRSHGVGAELRICNVFGEFAPPCVLPMVGSFH
jgi:hypothetical protein